MKQFIGLDVSLKDTFVSVRKEVSGLARQLPVRSETDSRGHPPACSERGTSPVRYGPPSGSVLSYADAGRPPNKTDANNADGLAHLAEVGFYREVRVKSFESMLFRTLVAARNQLLKMTTQLSNQIRSLMKTFGLVVPKGAGLAGDLH